VHGPHAGLPSENTELVFDAPTTDWAAKRTVPTVNVFLYDLREDLSRRASGQLAEHNPDGTLWILPIATPQDSAAATFKTTPF